VGLYTDLPILERRDVSGFECDVYGIATSSNPLIPEVIRLALSLLVKALAK
jgi:hypothetical protein